MRSKIILFCSSVISQSSSGRCNGPSCFLLLGFTCGIILGRPRVRPRAERTSQLAMCRVCIRLDLECFGSNGHCHYTDQTDIPRRSVLGAQRGSWCVCMMSHSVLTTDVEPWQKLCGNLRVRHQRASNDCSLWARRPGAETAGSGWREARSTWSGEAYARSGVPGTHGDVWYCSCSCAVHSVLVSAQSIVPVGCSRLASAPLFPAVFPAARGSFACHRGVCSS